MPSKLMDHNPSWRKPVLAVLPLCADRPCGRATVEDAAAKAWDPAYPQVPSSVIDALVREGYLNEQITVDGSAYGGTLEDAYRDDSVSDDADVDALLSITEAGRRVIEEYSPEATLAALFADRPRYGDVFRAILRAADTADGASRPQLEFVIDSALSRGSITAEDGQKIYPQYFLDALETAGGIAWDGAWRITPQGEAMLES